MNRDPIEYDGAKAQSQRDAMRTPDFTLRDVLNVFRAFARDFRTFDPNKVEHSNICKDSEEVGLPCSDESDSSFEGSDSSLDEMALLYAELEDMESEFDEQTLLDSTAQINSATSDIRNGDSVVKGTASLADQSVDETVSLKEESASLSKASASSPKVPSPASDVLSRIVHYPLSFVVHKGQQGNISLLQTGNDRAPYQYYIAVKPNQLLDPKNLHFIIEVLELEQVCATALTRFIEKRAGRKFGRPTPRWLPAVARNAAHEAVHDHTFRLLLDFLRNSHTFEDLRAPGNLIFEVREMLEDFYLVANSMEAPELRLFAHINNIVVLPDVRGMVSPSDIQAHLDTMDNKLCRFLQDADLEDFMEEAFYRGLFNGKQQKHASTYLNILWAKDPFKAKWTIVAKTYTMIRDKVGKQMAPLDDFLQLTCPEMGIIAASDYLQLLNWTVNDDNGDVNITQIAEPALNTLDGTIVGCSMTHLDLLQFVLDSSYLDDVDSFTDVVHHSNIHMLVSAATKFPDKAKAAFTAAIQKDPKGIAAFIFGADVDNTFFEISSDSAAAEADAEAEAAFDAAGNQVFGNNTLPMPPVAPMATEYPWACNMTELYGPSEMTLDFEAMMEGNEWMVTDIANPMDMDEYLKLVGGFGDDDLYAGYNGEPTNMMYQFNDSF